VTDLGAPDERPSDYPLFIRPCAEAVARGEHDFGIVLGGSGNGEAIVANKVHGVRCALVNNANCMAIGERTISEADALAFVDLFLHTAFDGSGRHGRRVRLIEGD
jgi:ribose 5-phosphate isomerase B